MKRGYLFVAAVIVIFLMIVSAIPFIWDFKSVDLEKFSQYGTFVSALIGSITLILVVYAYSATKEQIRLTQKQSFDSIYFNFIESHRSIIDRMQAGKANVFKQECENVNDKILKTLQQEVTAEVGGEYRTQLLNLRSETEEYLKNIDGKDAFDILYFILDKEYKLAGILWALQTKGQYLEPTFRLVGLF